MELMASTEGSFTIGLNAAGPSFVRKSHPMTGYAMKPETILHGELTHSIIGAAMKVLNTLKPGLDEKAYENALRVELSLRGHGVDQQKRFDVFYEGVRVDTLIPDLIVDGLVIVDPKVTEDFTATHAAQMTGYLAVTGLRLALLLNFKHATFGGSGLSDDQPIRAICVIRGQKTLRIGSFPYMSG
jgi:GxxExxY protein